MPARRRGTRGSIVVRTRAWFLAFPTALAVLVMASLGPVSAHASVGGDAAATRAYLQANYRLVETVASHIPRIVAALRGVLARVERECPAAAGGSPQDPQSTQLSDEVIGAMVMSVVALDRPAGRAFVNATAHLRWTDAALTRAIRSYVSKVRTLDALPQPGLCADVRAWAASGFQKLPATTLAFSPRFMEAWVAAGERPGALARYETSAERPLIARTERLEEQLTELEAREVETYAKIMNTLELLP